MQPSHILRRLPFLLPVFLVFGTHTLPAQTFTWQPAGGGTFDWNNAANWNDGSAFPNAAGDTAEVTTDIGGNQTIRLQQNITIGTLEIGDASNSYTLDPGAAGDNGLTFEAATAGGDSFLHTSGTVRFNNTVALGGTSSLVIEAAGTAPVTFSGSVQTNGNNITFLGGGAGANQFNLNGNIDGNGIITNSSAASVIISGSKLFTGTIVANSGAGGSNTGAFTLTNGSLASAGEFVINGYLVNGNAQQGGVIHAGNSSSQAVNPGQRFTQNRITMNGGSLVDAGQLLAPADTGSYIQDNVANFRFNSGYSYVLLGASTSTAGTKLNVATLERSAGASAYVRATTLGGTAQFLAGNAGDFLKGAGGAEGTTTMSIIPWIGANNTSSATANPSGFATYVTSGTSSGLRALNTNEYANSLAAGSDANVSVGSLVIASPTSVNSLRYTSGGASNIGASQVLTVLSGGVFFTNNNGAIGAAGNANAGTLNFGGAEGVVWTLGTNTNRIGAGITGSGGLTKAGTGTLVLAGDNSFSGLTYVGSGILQVGDGTNRSMLGLSGNVTIANGARLSLANDEAMADTAILTLESFGLYNGLLDLGFNETIGGLYLGEIFYAAGTFGSVGSGAAFESDQWFSGDGILTVSGVPEPSTVSLLALGFGALFFLRRRARR